MATLKHKSDKALNLINGNEVFGNEYIISESDTGRVKFGDGVTPYNYLGYAKTPGEYAEATGTNTYIITSPQIAITYFTGQPFRVKFTNTNTGASTLNVNSLGAKALVKNASDPLVAGDVTAGQIYNVCYDGTNMQIISPVFTSAGSGWDNEPLVGIGPTGIIEEWFAPLAVDYSASTGFIANRIFAEKFLIKKTITVDQMRCECTTAIAAKSAQIGLYHDNGFKFPGALRVDGGTVSLATTGIKAVTFGSAQVLTAGTVIWLAISTPDVNTVGFRYGIRRLGFIGRPAGVSTVLPWGWATVHTFNSTMPDPFPTATIGYISQTTQSPLVELHRSA